MNDDRELYAFTWPGKREAILEAGRPTDKVLRPVVEESVNFEATENLYIEGDNMEAMKILQRSYMRKVKMIYIDPPYNTGHDFIYSDDFAQDEEESREEYGLFDGEGTRNYTMRNYRENTRANPRYHSDWCSMIYPRLMLAHNLLRDDGVIFISIDDNEAANLRKICDEIFGENNFVANIVWQSRTSISNDYEISLNHNHTFIYAKDRPHLVFGGNPIDSSEYINPDNDPRGAWKLVPIDANHTGGDTVYPVRNPKTGRDYYPPNGRVWCYSKAVMQKLIADGRIKFGLADDSSPKRKLYLSERISKGDVKTPSSLIIDAGTTQTGTNEIMGLFDGRKVFSYPKPVEFIRRLVSYGAPKGGIVLDFFAGSSTTAHAVMSLNASDSGHRKFIMIQLPEPCPPSSEAAKAGYSTICALGRERIRRASLKLAQDFPLTAGQTDSGFRTLRVDSPNFRDVFISPDDLESLDLDSLADNLKPDRSPLDLLFMCITDSGLPLSLSLDSENFSGFTIYTYGSGEIIACFNECLTEDVITHIAQQKPSRAVFRNLGFQDSRTRINLEQVFKYYSPDSGMVII
ncbi:MAG: site-specific DNA-methyltransferase [Synergistaceae bacterium]|nr:site-specific DNA-methyltransferase [Synergistaceae bacterium]